MITSLPLPGPNGTVKVTGNAALGYGLIAASQCATLPLFLAHGAQEDPEIEVEAKDGDRTVRLLFSADVGPNYKLLHPDPTGPSGLRRTAF